MGELPFIWIFTRGSGPLWGQTTAATAGAGRRFRSPFGSCGAMDQSTLRADAANQTPVPPGHLSPRSHEPCRRGHEVSATSSHTARHHSAGGLAAPKRNRALPTKDVPGGVCMCRSVETGDFVGCALCRFPEARIPSTVLDGPLSTGRGPCRSGCGSRGDRECVNCPSARAGLSGTDSIKTSAPSPRAGRTRARTPSALARSPFVPLPGQGLHMADSRFRKGSWETELNAPRDTCVSTGIQAPPISRRPGGTDPGPQEVEQFESQANSEAQGSDSGWRCRGPRSGGDPAPERQRVPGQFGRRRHPQDPQGDGRLRPLLAARRTAG